MLRLLCLAAALASPASAQSSEADWVRSLLDRPPLASAPVAASPAGPSEAVIVSSREAAGIGESELWRRLAEAEVVYAGERHDADAHHAVQLEVLKALHLRKPGLTVGLEMIDFTRQAVLDDYLAGRMGDAEFAAFWEKAWGFPFTLYRPILEYARARGIPVRGLNAPIAVVRQIAKGGLSSLTPEQRRLLPERVDPIRDPRYLAYVREALKDHGPLDPAAEARMLEAMAAWNETMGRSVVSALERGPVFVIAGTGHLAYGAGILESVRSRRASAQAVVLPYPLDGEKKPLGELLKALLDRSNGELELADFFWLLPEG